MKGKEIIRYIHRDKMPNINQVRENCLQQLDSDYVFILREAGLREDSLKEAGFKEDRLKEIIIVNQRLQKIKKEALQSYNEIGSKESKKTTWARITGNGKILQPVAATLLTVIMCFGVWMLMGVPRDYADPLLNTEPPEADISAMPSATIEEPDAQLRERVTFLSEDGVEITADLYNVKEGNAPYIILFHGFNSSRGEFYNIAPRLMELGYNCLAVDLRIGGSAYPVHPTTGLVTRVNNLTFESLMDELSFAEAVRRGRAANHMDEALYEYILLDVKAAFLYTRDELKAEEIVVLGVSFSAVPSILLGSEFPDDIYKVMAFSPENSAFAERKIEEGAAGVKCPVLITARGQETVFAKTIYSSITSDYKIYLDVASNKANVLEDAQSPVWEDVIGFLKD